MACQATALGGCVPVPAGSVTPKHTTVVSGRGVVESDARAMRLAPSSDESNTSERAHAAIAALADPSRNTVRRRCFNLALKAGVSGVAFVIKESKLQTSYLSHQAPRKPHWCPTVAPVKTSHLSFLENQGSHTP